MIMSLCLVFIFHGRGYDSIIMGETTIGEF